MRELKFRAWDGEKLFYSDSFSSLESFFAVTDDEGYVEPKTVYEQYTGLKDKNGREIYEGDIIYCDGPHEFEWFGIAEYIAPSFEIVWEKSPYEAQNTQLNSNLLVIGNIHENPELLN